VKGGLRLENVSKTFSGRRVLDAVDLEVAAGTIHALVGANGSGKSTLIKALAGYHEPDAGAHCWVGGEEISLGSHAAAAAAGVRFVHQDLGLVADMTLTENLTLDEESGPGWWVGVRDDAGHAGRLLREYGLDLDVTRTVGSLGAAERTMLAVVRACRDGLDDLGLLVLDEPTGTLSTQETGQLFELLEGLRRRGASVLFVTHRLEEVFEIADRVTVLRDGRKVLDADTADLDEGRLVETIVGRPLDAFYPEPPPAGREILFEVQRLTGPNVQGVEFAVHGGEILGIAGLTGSGRETIVPLLAGAIPWTTGEVTVAGERYEWLDSLTAIGAGIGYVPADRKGLGSILEFTVRENLTLPQLRVGSAGWLSLRQERAEAADWLERLAVQPRQPEALFSTLSGGNQQRVILARLLRCGSRVFVLDEPTQGVDVAGKADIYEALVAAARAGACVVMASTDADELAATCDRVLVLRAGRICAELTSGGLTAPAISHHEHRS
jgi:ribose transport system ATP-binding protein